MSIKILGGLAKGRSLSVLDVENLRPTSVMLRRRVFDSKQNLRGIVFVDLCAGTGAVGLEALSRGADQVYLIENHSKIFSFLKKNCQVVSNGLSLDAHLLIKEDSLRFLESFKKTYLALNSMGQKEAILFFDPPYLKHDLYKLFVDMIRKDHWFIGELWIESDVQKGVDPEFFENKGLPCKKLFKQGTSYIYIVDASLSIL